MRVRTMHPSNVTALRTRSVTNKKNKTKKQTPHFRTYSRRALYDLPQTLHDDRARRAHHKRCHSFLDLIHSFSARGQNVDFWLLSKNNTGRLPLRGNPAGKERQQELGKFFMASQAHSTQNLFFPYKLPIQSQTYERI